MHLTRGELWILGWLEREGFRADVYSDLDFHNDGCDAAQYACLVVGTHPEYWTTQMYDNVASPRRAAFGPRAGRERTRSSASSGGRNAHCWVSRPNAAV